jgi:predicted nucleotidyltransferase
MMTNAFQLQNAQVADYCSRSGIRRLSVFGSALTDRFGPGSDLDILVEFCKGREPGFLGLARIQRELSDIVGHRVDLRTPAELSRHFRQEVEELAEVQYAAS